MKKARGNKPQAASKNPKLVTLEIRNQRYHLCADGVSVFDSANKWYCASKKEVYMGATSQYKDMTAAANASVGGSNLDRLAEDNPALAFPINKRFEFLEDLVNMVATKKVPSAIVTGEGGLGKSFVVVKALKAAGLKDITEMPIGSVARGGMFRVVKGYSSVKGLYDILYENKDAILVFDDCDSVFDDSDALMLLKAALDSYDKRWITWNISRGFGDTSIPRSFQFNGGCIFISNLAQTKIDQAVRTRAMCIDVSMNTEQKLDRMSHIMESDEFLPYVPMQCKKDALALLTEFKDSVRDLSLRSLITVSRIRANKPIEKWRELAIYMLVN